MRRFVSVVSSIVFLAACSSSGTDTGTNSNGTNYNNATGTMSAKVDGTTWTANYATRATLTNGVLSITGENFDGNTATLRAVTMAAANIVTVGTYTLGPAGDGHGGNAIMSLGTTVWSSVATGGSGTLTVTTLNTTHVVGSFAFVGIASGVSSNVTAGTFDIPF